MMNYHKYPLPSAYPPHTLPIAPLQDPRVAPHPPPPAAAAPPPPPQPPPPAPYPSYAPPQAPSPRVIHEQFRRREPEMPRSAPPPAPPPAYNHTNHNSSLRYAAPVPAPYAHDNGYASLRNENNGYHVSQANHGSRKRPHLDEGFQSSSAGPGNKSNHNYFSGPDRRISYQEGQQDQSSAPPLGTRRMPPPSPPQHYPSRGQSGNPPSLSTPFLSREPPNTAAHHRPGSSMSISSMLGADADRPARDVGSSSIFSRLPVSSGPFGSAPPPSAPGAMSPPTAPARPSPLEYPLFRRSQTPEKSFSKSQPGRPYRSSSGGVPQSSAVEQSKFGGLSRLPSTSQYPPKPNSSHASPQVSAADSPYSTDSRRLSFSGPVPRPSSQPQHLEPPPRPGGYSPLSRPAATPGESSYGSTHHRQSSYLGHDSHNRFGGVYADRHAEDQVRRERERGLSHQPESKAAPPPSRYGSLYGDRDRDPPGGRQQSSAPTWDVGRSQPTSPETKRFSAPEAGAGFGFGAIQNYTKSLGSQSNLPRQSSLSVQPQQGQRNPSPNKQSPYLSKRQPESRLFSSAQSASSSLAHSSDDPQRKGSDEPLHHRNLLGVSLDAKRGGRASPLPQAVQGAQAQIIGPAGESGIKSELGRVFAGIGSGVGGVGGVTASNTGSGPSTPMAASPFKRDSVTARSTNSETTTDETKVARPTSATGKRPRKSREEENRAESESGFDLRLGASGRGGRRSRHVHHHHHHHHHHKPEEEAPALGGTHRPLSSMTLFHRTQAVDGGSSEAALSAGHHHHHHHHPHHHHHHHHHGLRPAAPFPPANVAPMREPRTVVTIEPVLSSVAHLPRHHLGSTLYAPRIGAPTTKATLESARFGYTTTPLPLPRFEGKENCTFTIRVPRFRIDASHREEICARRALWGTGVYTDDSDPVAAAIHSGFIRGAWGEDVDVDMLDLEIKDSFQHAPKTAQDMGIEEGERPRTPQPPPPDKDLHITLLILPRLERYDSSVLFGLRSRAWEGSHDGMSFKVLRTEWVDEGVGRGEERSGEARRKRLRNLMHTGRICTGPGVVKLEQLRNGIIQIPRRQGKALEGQDQPPAAPVQTVS